MSTTASKASSSETVTPKAPPAKISYHPAIVSFVSGDSNILLGDTNKHGTEAIQAAYTSKHTGTDLPYLGFRIRLRRSEDTMHLHQGAEKEFHNVVFKYHKDDYDIEHHRATLDEKNDFLDITNRSEKAVKVCNADKLYIIKFSLGGKKGPEIHGFGSSFIGANDEVNDTFTHLSSIADCEVVQLYLWELRSLASHVEWLIQDQAKRTDPLKYYYMPSKKTTEPQAYVQWNQLREKDINNPKPFDHRRGLHSFDDFTSCTVSMAVLKPPGSDGDYYFAFLSVPDWDTYSQLFGPNDKILITWTPPPEIKLSSEKKEGEKDPKDSPPGWIAVVMEENILFSDAPLMVMLYRPGEDRPLADMKMRAAEDIDQGMPEQQVFIKTSPSAFTIKARLKALDKHRYHRNPSPAYDEKRRILVGRDLSVNRTVDLLEGISEEKVREITDGLNLSQLDCILQHCREVQHGINMIMGPFGSGKTLLVRKLCELQKLREPGSKTFVTASSNSACDAVVPKFASSELVVVRAHGLSLERETLMQPYFKAKRKVSVLINPLTLSPTDASKLREADPVPDDYERPEPPRPRKQTLDIEGAETIIGAGHTADVQFSGENEGDEGQYGYVIDGTAESGEFDGQSQGEGFDENPEEEAGSEHNTDDDNDMDVTMFKATVDVMKFCQQRYDSRGQFLSPQDPRMKRIDVAIHTWILKFTGILDTEHTNRAIKSSSICTEFREYYEKSKTQVLNEMEWLEFQKAMTSIAKMALNAADVIIATTMQTQTDLLKDIVFAHVIIDEISMATHAEMLCAWRGDEVLTMIGDLKQLPSTVMSSPNENPFAHVLSYGPFQRFADLGLRVFLLRHIMRMTAGLEALCNEIFYNSMLIRGPGTSVDDPQRRISRLIQASIEGFPQVEKAPVDVVYPIFFDVQGVCQKEANGTSRLNTHNIAVIIEIIKDLRDDLDRRGYKLTNDKIGIASPYAAQVRATRRALMKAGECGIRVGVTGSWQGAEMDIMFVDLVRAKNPDKGDLNSLTKKERLNVLLSRQRQFLFVVGDMTCCESSYQPFAPVEETNDSAEAGDASGDKKWGQDKKNAVLMSVLTWFRERGRVVKFPLELVSEEYVTLL